MADHPDYLLLKDDFLKVEKTLQALGDQTRFHIVMCLFELPCQSDGGARVGEITAKTNLSRPAISHHLKILKEAGIVGMRREGTKNYYYFDPDQTSFELLINVFQKMIFITSSLPDRSKSSDEE